MHFIILNISAFLFPYANNQSLDKQKPLLSARTNLHWIFGFLLDHLIMKLSTTHVRFVVIVEILSCSSDFDVCYLKPLLFFVMAWHWKTLIGIWRNPRLFRRFTLHIIIALVLLDLLRSDFHLLLRLLALSCSRFSLVHLHKGLATRNCFIVDHISAALVLFVCRLNTVESVRSQGLLEIAWHRLILLRLILLLRILQWLIRSSRHLLWVLHDTLTLCFSRQTKQTGEPNQQETYPL